MYYTGSIKDENEEILSWEAVETDEGLCACTVISKAANNDAVHFNIRFSPEEGVEALTAVVMAVYANIMNSKGLKCGGSG